MNYPATCPPVGRRGDEGGSTINCSTTQSLPQPACWTQITPRRRLPGRRKED